MTTVLKGDTTVADVIDYKIVGKVYLQSLPLSRLAERNIVAGPVATAERRGAAGLGGDFLGGLNSGE